MNQQNQLANPTYDVVKTKYEIRDAVPDNS